MPVENNPAAGETTYQVILDLFQGPLDLLLQLIERKKLDITRVSLAMVTDQYLEYVSRMKDVPLSLMANFLAVAARLLLIKSRSLLPAPPLLVVDEEEDPAEVLARQLKEYRRFKEIAGLMGQRHAAGLRSYVRVMASPEVPRQLVPGAVTLEDLVAAVQSALARLDGDEVPLPSTVVVTPHPVTIHDKITIIKKYLQRGEVSFYSLLRGARARVEVIVTFLALLELLKQKAIQVQQDELFGDILIIPTKSDDGDAGAVTDAIAISQPSSV